MLTLSFSLSTEFPQISSLPWSDSFSSLLMFMCLVIIYGFFAKASAAHLYKYRKNLKFWTI